jgi:DNA mismatch repair protein MutS
MNAETPIRRQYLEIKARHKDALLLFRLGDFYEAFDDDARILAKELEIVLTSKPMGKDLRVPLAGIPYHSLERHLATLISRGHRVAICDQTSTVPIKGEDGNASFNAK